MSQPTSAPITPANEASFPHYSIPTGETKSTNKNELNTKHAPEFITSLVNLIDEAEAEVKHDVQAIESLVVATEHQIEDKIKQKISHLTHNEPVTKLPVQEIETKKIETTTTMDPAKISKSATLSQVGRFYEDQLAAKVKTGK